MTFVNFFDSVPTQAGQSSDILNGCDLAEIGNESFEGACVVLFGVCEFKAWLLYCTAVFALKSRNLDNEFGFSIAHWQHFESSCSLAELNDIARFAVRALDIVAVYAAVNNGLTAKKFTLMY